jgi:hypothetical protein
MDFFLSRWLRRFRVLREQARVEREMDEEMRFHVAMEAEELQRTHGLSPAEAHRQAMITFGGVERHRESGREARGVAWLSPPVHNFGDVFITPPGQGPAWP